MSHPLVPQLTAQARPIARELGLELVEVAFQPHQSPPVVHVAVRNPHADTSLDDCERMSRALEAQLDAEELVPGAYLLEVSSPGVPKQLTTDREFASFKGFAVRVRTSEPYKGRREWCGNLQGRDADTLYLNQKGKPVRIPRRAIATVMLDSPS
jgi:ribosome maturation factor RimP